MIRKRINVCDMNLMEVGMAKWVLEEMLKANAKEMPPKVYKYIRQVLQDALDDINKAEAEWAAVVLMRRAESEELQ